MCAFLYHTVCTQQDAFAPGTIFVPHQQSSAAGAGLAHAHSEHVGMHGSHDPRQADPRQRYMRSDSALFQHYADMGLAQEAAPSSLHTEPNLSQSPQFTQQQHEQTRTGEQWHAPDTPHASVHKQVQELDSTQHRPHLFQTGCV